MSDYYGIEPKFIGKNNASNGVSTSAVVSNADGTVLERLEYLQTAIGGSAGQLRFQQSASNVVEDDSFAQFEVTLIDVNSGAITSTNINIASITVELSKSTGGGAFSAVGITQPTFSKADGRVYTSNRFLAAEWSVGDVYKLTIKDIVVTFGTEYAYVPMMVWCNIITDIIDIDTIVDDIKTQTSRIHETAVTVGMVAGSLSTFIAGNNGGLGSQLPASTSLYDTTKNISTVGITSAPVEKSLADILHKDGSFTYDNTTDSLEAISDAISEGTSSVTAAAGSTTTTVVDATFTQGDNYWRGCLMLCTAGDNIGQARIVDSFTASTDTFNFTQAWSADPTGDTFVLISGYGVLGWLPQADVAVTDTVTTTESDCVIFNLSTAGNSYKVNSLRLKFADPGANTVTVNLSELINDVLTVVDSFTVTTANYGTYFSLMDMFGTMHLSGDSLKVSCVMDANTCAVTGQYSYEKAYSA
jgi:hypothetical protein